MREPHGKVLFLYGHWTGQFSSTNFISSYHNFSVSVIIAPVMRNLAMNFDRPAEIILPGVRQLRSLVQ